ARWLMQTRQGAAWDSTEDTASVIYALGAYLRRERQLAPPRYTATVTVHGEVVGRVEMTPAKMFAPVTVAIPERLLSGAGDGVRIERQGTGRLLYSLSLRTYVRGENLPAESS